MTDATCLTVDDIAIGKHRHYFGSIDLAARIAQRDGEEERVGETSRGPGGDKGGSTRGGAPEADDPGQPGLDRNSTRAELFTLPNWLLESCRESFSIALDANQALHEIRADYDPDLLSEIIEFLRFIDAPIPDEVTLELQALVPGEALSHSQTAATGQRIAESDPQTLGSIETSVLLNVGEAESVIFLARGEARADRDGPGQTQTVAIGVMPQEGLALGSALSVRRVLQVGQSPALLVRIGAKIEPAATP